MKQKLSAVGPPAGAGIYHQHYGKKLTFRWGIYQASKPGSKTLMIMNRYVAYMSLVFWLAVGSAGWSSEMRNNEGRADQKDEDVSNKSDRVAFEQAAQGPWQAVFSDPCTGDWQARWFLDGEVGTVKTGGEGMTLTAGPEFKNDAHHMVLWTKASFEGDVKIEYDYTRLDNENRCVNILYIEATGSGKGPYAKDITQWNDLRRVPAMSAYFDHMNTYHISYAAFPEGYIRARRYMPEQKGLKGSDLKPDYYPKDLFATGVKHHITVIKRDRDLFMRVENPDGVTFCHMANPDLPVITEGRIGLRHMFTRSARYKDITVSVARSQLDRRSERRLGRD